MMLYLVSYYLILMETLYSLLSLKLLVQNLEVGPLADLDG